MSGQELSRAKAGETMPGASARPTLVVGSDAKAILAARELRGVSGRRPAGVRGA